MSSFYCTCPIRRLYQLSHHALFASLYAIFLLLLPQNSYAADAGESNPIVPVERRTLFSDQHVMLAMPLNPITMQGDSTYTDWARSENLQSLQWQDSFINSLQGVTQARSASGHILSQVKEQIAVAFFSGSANAAFNTLTINILNTDGSLNSDASTSIPAVSTDVLYSSAAIANSFDITTGELSLRVDDLGIGHSEVVLCTFKQQSNVFNPRLNAQITVIDYTDIGDTGITKTQVLASQEVTNNFTFAKDLTFLGRDASDSSIACAAGDINGDGVDEIIVSYIYRADSSIDQWVGTFQYSNDGTNPPKLAEVGTNVSLNATSKEGFLGAGAYNGSVDVATGDFNADHKLDIAVSSVSRQFSSDGLVANFPAVRVISSDDSFNLTLESTFIAEEKGTAPSNDLFDSVGSYACNKGSNSACEYMRGSLVTGLFRFNPGAGFDFNRRQLALVFNMPSQQNGGLRAFPLSISSDLKTISQIGDTVTLPQQSCPNDTLCPSGQRFSVAAGGLIGSADIDNPLWSLAVTNWDTALPGNGSKQAKGEFHGYWLKAQSGENRGSGFELSWEQVLLSGADINGSTNARLPAQAWDREGNSLWLGAPVQLTIYQLIATDYIIQEPPKHAYWWPPSATEPGQGNIMNVSRKEDFFIQLKDEEELNYAFTHTDQTDWSIGGSVTASASGSVTTGVSAGLLGSAKVTGSQSVTAKVGYDYNENKSGYESGYGSQTTTFTGETSSDDLIIADLQIIDIWRYPVSGIQFEEDLNAFWEIAFPGRSVTVQAGGLVFDWYQPIHENGNILSYEKLSGTDYTPADCCAPFSFIEGSSEVQEAIPFLDDRLVAFDGVAGTIGLDFSSEVGEGSTKTYTHSLKESLDVHVGYKAEASFAGNKAEASASVDANINNSNSWAEINTENSATSNSTGFTLSKPPGNSNQSYFFIPTFYLAEDGTTKVQHGVDILGTGATFWQEIYGVKPDPALNLPRRFSSVDDTLVINPSADAKRVRRFFVRYNTLEEGDGYPLIDGAAIDGQEVRLEIDVYNYSTHVSVSNVNVAFEAVELNQFNKEINRVPISCGAGSNILISLNPQERRNAICVWDTSGFGPLIPGLKKYRIYVTLDPDNSIDELYEGTEGPGQNNQGWALLDVAAAEDAYRVPTVTESVPLGADVHMIESSLAIEVNGILKTEHVQVTRQQLTPLRVCVHSDQTMTGYYNVLVWDSVDGQERQLIADELVQGVDSNANSCTWLPSHRFSESGEHALYAEVLETREHESLIGNANDALLVNVLEIPEAEHERSWGIALGVGADKRQGKVIFNAVYNYSGSLNLSESKVLINSVLNEINGTGELVPGISEKTGQALVLYPDKISRNKAWYHTAERVYPYVELTLQTKKTQIKANLSVFRAEILEPADCGIVTQLISQLTVLDEEKSPVILKAEKQWRCSRNQHGKITQLRTN